MLLLGAVVMLVAVVAFVYLYSGAEHMPRQDLMTGSQPDDTL